MNEINLPNWIEVFKSIVERPVPKVCDMQCMHDSVVMNIHVFK